MNRSRPTTTVPTAPTSAAAPDTPVMDRLQPWQALGLTPAQEEWCRSIPPRKWNETGPQAPVTTGGQPGLLYLLEDRDAACRGR